MKPKKIGITGSRKGLTDSQREKFLKSLAEFSNVEIHHGDCVGVDEGIHKILFAEKGENPKVIQITIHPPSDNKQRAFCETASSKDSILVHSLATEDYLTRNQSIVDHCEELWAFPDGPEKLRSGTWATIRYAKKVGKPVRIF